MRRRTIVKYFETTVIALTECKIKLSARPRVGKEEVGGRYLDGEIVIKDNPAMENLLLNLIHEAWHHIKPDWTEKQIDSWSRKLFCEFSTDELKALSTFLRRQP